MGRTTYAVAIGSNRCGRYGNPRAMVLAAIRRLRHVRAASPIVRSAPMGPSIREYANAVVILRSRKEPPALLRRLKAVERRFGRRPGQRWGARPIDLDIILWSEGAWVSPGLVVPHPRFRERRFVLDPLLTVAPDWRDPVTGRTVRQLARRIRRARPVDRTGRHA